VTGRVQELSHSSHVTSNILDSDLRLMPLCFCSLRHLNSYPLCLDHGPVTHPS
jgi:hypothetical protein